MTLQIGWRHDPAKITQKWRHEPANWHRRGLLECALGSVGEAGPGGPVHRPATMCRLPYPLRNDAKDATRRHPWCAETRSIAAFAGPHQACAATDGRG
jgi:hypothetical protein